MKNIKSNEEMNISEIINNARNNGEACEYMTLILKDNDGIMNSTELLNETASVIGLSDDQIEFRTQSGCNSLARTQLSFERMKLQAADIIIIENGITMLVEGGEFNIEDFKMKSAAEKKAQKAVDSKLDILRTNIVRKHGKISDEEVEEIITAYCLKHSLV